MTSFKWIKPEVECYDSTLTNGAFEFYRSFSYNNEIYSTGEFVFVYKTDNPKCAQIGKLLCVYHSNEKWHRQAPYRGMVRWYTWAKDFKPSFDLLHKEFDENNEVVEDKRGKNIYISLEQVQKKCCIVFATEDDPVYLIKDNKLDPKIYFSCRYRIEHKELVPIFSQNEFNESFVNEYMNPNELSLLTERLMLCSPIKKTNSNPVLDIGSGNKLLPRSKRKPSDNSKIIIISSGESDSEEENKVKSPLNPLKNVKLTPGKKNRDNGAVPNKKSVKRVLNDSFNGIGTPKMESSENVNIKLKLVDSAWKVFPTKLSDEVTALGSPVKVQDLENVNNCITLSPKKSRKSTVFTTKNEIIENCLNEKRQELLTPSKRSRQSIKSTISKDTGTPTSRMKTRQERILNEISEDGDICKGNTSAIQMQLRTPQKIEYTTRRRSTRNVERKIYTELDLIETDSPEKQKKTTRLKGLNEVATSIKQNGPLKESVTDVVGDNNGTFRPKRVISPPKRYRSDQFSTPRKQQDSETSNTDDDDDDDDSIHDKNNKQTRSSRKTESATTFGGICTRRTSTCTPKAPAAENLRKNALRCASSKKSTYPIESDKQIVKTQKSTPRKGSKDTPTARARMVKEGIITPSVQSRKNAIVEDKTPLGKTRTRLHVSYVPNILPCREREFADITNFLRGKLLDGCGGCMYISGVPGTGKTATVTEVVKNLQNAAEDDDVPTFKYIHVNGMRLSEPRQAYVEVMKQLTGKTLSWEEAQTTLENRFIKSQKNSLPIVLVVDELDILCTKRQDVIYNFLDWPTKGNTQLIVITIANTMDLPERLLMGRITSRLGLTRLTFQAYTHKQLQEIVMKRLTGVNTFDPDAIQLVARKVASISGDARRALDICRRAAEEAAFEGIKTLVTMVHVNRALNSMITHPKVQAIKHCCRLEKLILQAVVAEIERTGLEETSFTNVTTTLVTIAALDGFEMVSNTIAKAAIARLGACRLLLTDQKCSDIHQKIILNVSSDDVYYALMKTDASA